MSNETTNVAIVGCGYWGPNLIRNFNAQPNCTVKMVCDQRQERLDYMKSLYEKVQTTQDYNDIINDKDIQAVIIATPVSTHFKLAKQALEAGKHTFLEKPITASAAEAEALIKLAKEKECTLMVGHTFLYSAPVRKIKEIVDNGDLGKIMYMSARRLNLGLFQTDINVAWDLAPHDLSVMFHVLGEQAESVNCVGQSNITQGVEDVTSMSITLGHNTFATVQSSWLDPNKIREITFVGTKRMLVYNDVELFEKIKIYDRGVDAPPAYNSFSDFAYSYRNGDVYSPAFKMVEPLSVEANHFLECVRTGQKCLTGGEEGLQVVQILEASSQSLAQDGSRIALS